MDQALGFSEAKYVEDNGRALKHFWIQPIYDTPLWQKLWVRFI